MKLPYNIIHPDVNQEALTSWFIILSGEYVNYNRQLICLLDTYKNTTRNYCDSQSPLNLSHVVDAPLDRAIFGHNDHQPVCTR